MGEEWYYSPSTMAPLNTSTLTFMRQRKYNAKNTVDLSLVIQLYLLIYVYVYIYIHA